jgi:hypothetical protein
MTASATADDSNPVVAGRRCGDCTLCCKVLKIVELNKPQGAWCQHCKPGKGCQIYSGRPHECQRFYCGYLLQENLGEEWKPNHSKIIIVTELNGNRISAHVDPQRPDAWKREPFYNQLKQWAKAVLPSRGQVVACVGRHAYMIFPDRDVDLGLVGDDELIVTRERSTPSGTMLDAYKIHKDDPRARTLVPNSVSSPPSAIT